MSRERGQASIEVVALAPLAVLLALVAAQVLAAGLCRSLAADAARAGAVALLEDEDPRAAAREALPAWARGRLELRRSGRRIRGRLRPPGLLPGLPRLLGVQRSADAGPRA